MASLKVNSAGACCVSPAPPVRSTSDQGRPRASRIAGPGFEAHRRSVEVLTAASTSRGLALAHSPADNARIDRSRSDSSWVSSRSR